VGQVSIELALAGLVWQAQASVEREASTPELEAV
jgi:hypothetical protein